MRVSSFLAAFYKTSSQYLPRRIWIVRLISWDVVRGAHVLAVFRQRASAGAAQASYRVVRTDELRFCWTR